MAEREQHVYLAKLAEQAERYDEMVDSMKEVAKLQIELYPEERNLLSVGYKNVIGSRRASWRIISSIEAKEAKKEDEKKLKLIQEYRATIEKELSDICADVLKVLDLIIPHATNVENQVFFYKMKGDYCRYKAEYLTGEERSEAADLALKAYTDASEIQGLDATNPIALGLALNFSVFYYEILGKHEEAATLAKKAFDEAVAKLDQLSEESYKDSTLIMQLLRDNLTLWTADMNADEEEIS